MALLRWLPLSLAALVLLVSCARSEPKSLEAMARELERSLACPICPQQTLETSDTETSKEMKALIREKLAAGESKEEILSYFVDRYGDEILTSPPKRGPNLVLWVLPPVALLAGAGLVYLALRRWPRPAPAASSEAEAPYRERVERELEELRRQR